MKSTGIIRRIDDLGRIVIPKEIRKSLGIRDGESIEITVEDNNIKLIKSNILNNYYELIKDVCYVFEKLNIGTLIITDREKVTAVTNNSIDLETGIKISKDLEEIIDSRKNYYSGELTSLAFEENKINGYFLIYPIIIDSNPLGSVILYNDTKSLQDGELLISFITLFLSRKMDIS